MTVGHQPLFIAVCSGGNCRHNSPFLLQTSPSPDVIRPAAEGRVLPVGRSKSRHSIRLPGLRPVTDPLQSPRLQIPNDRSGRKSVGRLTGDGLPLVGQSCRWRFDPAATAMGWSPAIGQTPYRRLSESPDRQATQTRFHRWVTNWKPQGVQFQRVPLVV